MAGHTLTPYEFVATRKWARKEKKGEHLLLASLGEDKQVDLLEVIEQNILAVEPVVSTDDTRTVRCVQVESWGDAVAIVLAAEISGEREVVRDGADAARPVTFVKGRQHLTAYYSCCVVWRPASGTEGILLMHSPWGRGGNRGELMKLLQRAVDADPDAKTKLRTNPLVPQKALARLLRRASATRIIYSKRSGIRSTFDNTNQSAPAEMDLVVKGSDSVPYRNALAAAIRSGSDEQLFTVRVRDESQKGGYREEEFDDVEVDLETAGGRRRYSVKGGTIPTVGFNITPDVNNVYYRLPDDQPDRWPTELLDGLSVVLKKTLDEVQRDLA